MPMLKEEELGLDTTLMTWPDIVALNVYTNQLRPKAHVNGLSHAEFSCEKIKKKTPLLFVQMVVTASPP